MAKKPKAGAYFLGGSCEACGGASASVVVPKEKLAHEMFDPREGKLPMIIGCCVECGEVGFLSDFKRFRMEAEGAREVCRQGLPLVPADA